MEVHQLRYFVAAAELGNFTRAAARCYVSQPSLSQQILKLEQELGQTLFERLGKKTQLTEAGRLLYDRAVGILAELENARLSVRAVEHWQAGEVSLGAILTVAPFFMPDVVRQFRRDFPAATIKIRENFTHEIVAACAAGELDVGIVALPIEDARLATEPILTEPLVLATPAKHPLEGRKRITLEDIAEERFVMLDEMHCLGEQIVSFCRHNEMRPAIGCEAAQLSTVLEMVSLDQGISLIPHMATRNNKHRRLSFRKLHGPAPERTIAMIWHKDRHPRQLVRQLTKVVHAVVQQWETA